MFCEFCDTSIEESLAYCPECGVELDREEVTISNYFEKGYYYEKIIIFLSKVPRHKHQFENSKKSYGLSRKRMNVYEEFVRRM